MQSNGVALQSSNLYEKNSTLPLTAVAAPGYAFSHWAGNLNGSTNPADILLDSDNKSVTAVFTATSYALRVIVKGGMYPLGIGEGAVGYGGTVTVTRHNPDSTTVVDYDQTIMCTPNEEVELTLQTEYPYGFHHWEENQLNAGNDEPRTMTMTSNRTVVATFNFTMQLDTTVQPPAAQATCSIQRSPNYYYYNWGDPTLWLTAVPGPGWRFDHWYMGISGTDNPINVPVNVLSRNAWAVFIPQLEYNDVRINEVVTWNTSGLKDTNNAYQPWVELYNSRTTDVNLTNWSITDDPATPRKWVFPANVSIPANGYMTLFLKGGTGSSHPNFTSWGPDSHYLALYTNDTPAVKMSEFAPSAFEARADWAYSWSSEGYLFTNTPTSGQANQTATVKAVISVAPTAFNFGSVQVR